MSEIISHLEANRNKQPNKLAFKYLKDGDQNTESVTYAEVLDRAKALALLLEEKGLRNTNALLVYMPGLDFIMAYLACLYAGVIAVPAYPPLLRKLNIDIERLELICRDAKPSIILADSLSAKLLKTAYLKDNFTNLIGRFLRWNTEKIFLKETPMIATDTLDLSHTAFLKEVDPKATAFIQYSSGSTGLPKGVVVSHENLMANIRNIEQVLQVKRDTIGLSWLPHYHDMGLIGFILTPLIIGCEIVLLSPVSFLENPLRWLKALSKYKATHSGGPNFGYELCIKHLQNKPHLDLDLSHWKVAMCGAEPINPNLVDRFYEVLKQYGYKRESFFPMYGLAEHTLLATGGEPGIASTIKAFDKFQLLQNEAHEVDSSHANAKTIISCGRPLSNHELLIVDPETSHEQPAGKIGEIWLKGRSVANGYWRKEDETGFAFNAFTAQGKGPFLRTGDLGFMYDGELYIVGRIKDVIIVRGKKYVPQDLEFTIQDHVPAIRKGNIAAFPIENNMQEQVGIVAEISKTYRDNNYQEIFNSILTIVSQRFELAIGEIILIKPQTIKKTTSGKIQRKACKQAFMDNKLDVVAAWKSPALK